MYTLNIRYLPRNIIHCDKKYYVTSFFNELCSTLADMSSDYKFDIANDQSYEKYGYGGIYSCMSMSIINPHNNKYILISFFDNWRYHFMKHMGWNPENMIGFFYAGGFNFFEYFSFKLHNRNNHDTAFPVNIQNVYSPIFYSPYFDCCYEKINDIFNMTINNNNKIQKLFFIGYMWDFRKHMTSILETKSDILIVDKNQNNQNLSYEQYLLEMSKYVCGISLPGGTEICNRDIESFAIGIPVIRPLITTQYTDPIIPNYHYINCYHACDYISNGNPKYLSYIDLQNHILYTWNNIKSNTEYLRFIATNAHDWYLKNINLRHNVHNLSEKILSLIPQLL